MKRVDQNINGLTLGDVFGLMSNAGVGGCADAVVDEKLIGLKRLLSQKKISSKKVCLINPPQLEPMQVHRDVVGYKRYMDYPPLGLMYISSAIKYFCGEWGVDIYDLNLESLKNAYNGAVVSVEDMVDAIPDEYDAYGISVMFEAGQELSGRVLKRLQDKNKLIIVGGAHALCVCQDMLMGGVCDIVIKKEGELQVVKLLKYWSGVHNNKNMLNPCFVNVAYAKMSDMESKVMEFDDSDENLYALDLRDEYSSVRLDDYNSYGAPSIWARIAASGKKWATMVTSRGCRGNCIFCQVSSIMGRGVRSRGAGDVIDEIKYLYESEGVRHIEFVDDDLLGNLDNAKQWLKKLINLNLDLTFSIGSGVLAIGIDKEVACLLRDAGCVMIGFGAETGNLERFKGLRKPTSLPNVYNACQIIKNEAPDMWLQVNFILGFPGETYGELLETFNYAKSLDVDYCQSSILRVIAGTEISEDSCRVDDHPNAKADTAGRDIVSRGLTFDDVFDSVIDFRAVSLDDVPDYKEIQQFQIYFNTQLNLIQNKNLFEGGRPFKVKNLTRDVLAAYPMDAVSWAAYHKSSGLCGEDKISEMAWNRLQEALAGSWYWRKYFEIYDVGRRLGVRLDAK